MYVRSYTIGTYIYIDLGVQYFRAFEHRCLTVFVQIAYYSKLRFCINQILYLNYQSLRFSKYNR